MANSVVQGNALSSVASSTAHHGSSPAHAMAIATAHLESRVAGRMIAPTRDFLSFRLGDAEYGIEIDTVLEIRNWEAPTPLADSPPFVKGVINLRGRIVPIVDLRLRLHLAAIVDEQATAVLIVTLEQRTVGLIVDSTADVLSLRPEQILPAPAFTSALRTEHIAGLGTQGDRMVILIAIAQLLSSDGLIRAESRLS